MSESKELTPEQLVQKIQCYFLDSKISRDISANKRKLLEVARILISFESADLKIDMRDGNFIISKE